MDELCYLGPGRFATCWPLGCPERATGQLTSSPDPLLETFVVFSDAGVRDLPCLILPSCFSDLGGIAEISAQGLAHGSSPG